MISGLLIVQSLKNYPQFISLNFKKINNQESIEDMDSTIEYNNQEYGFIFKLPLSWNNYSIIVDTWDGYSLDPLKGDGIIERGPFILIRHPKWTSEVKRQDIPILVFSIIQWNNLEKEEFHIGAAPIGPKELGRNSRYIFALPARYNYAFLDGFEEVEDILSSNSLVAY